MTPIFNFKILRLPFFVGTMLAGGLLISNCSPQANPDLSGNTSQEKVGIPSSVLVEVPSSIVRAKRRKIQVDSIRKTSEKLRFKSLQPWQPTPESVSFQISAIHWKPELSRLQMATGFIHDSLHVLDAVSHKIPTGRAVSIDGSKKNISFSQPQKELRPSIEAKAIQNILVYDKKQGIPSNYINDVLFDKDGYMYMATGGGGLVKYDANQYWTLGTAQGLPSNNVTALEIDKNGAIWIATHGGGLVCWRNNEAMIYNQESGLLSDYITAIYVDQKQRVWVATEAGGVSVIEGEDITHISTNENGPADVILKIKEDRGGNMIFISKESGLFRLKDDSVELFGHSIFKDQKIIDFLPITEDKIQIATDKAIYEISDSSVYKLTNFQPNSDIYAIFKGLNNSTIITTMGTGLFILNKDKLAHYSTHNGLSNDFIPGVAVDSDSSIWAYTLGGGMNKFPRQTIRYFNTEGKLPYQDVTCILETKDQAKWFSFLNGNVCKVINGKYKQIDFAGIKRKSPVRAMLETKDGNVWMGTEAGEIYVLDPQNIQKFKSNLNLNFPITSLFEDRKGRIWIGSKGGGVTMLEAQTAYVYSKRGGMSSNSVFCIEEDHMGRICLGMDEGGFSILENEVFTHFKLNSNGNSEVLSIVKNEQGNLWLATFGAGLFSYDGLNFRQINENTGLVSNRLMGLNQRNKNELLLFSEEAIVRLGVNSAFDEGEESSGANRMFTDLQVINEDNGVLSQGIFVNSQIVDQQGELWVGARETMMSLDIRAEFPKRYTSPPRLESLSVINKSGDLKKENRLYYLHDSIETYKISAQPQLVQLNYSVPAWGSDHSTLWRYKILEKHNDWQVMGNNSILDFKSLSAGNYTIAVSAGIIGGSWGTNRIFKLEIKPRWYLSPWAFVAYVAMIMVLAHYYSYKKSQLLRNRQVKLKHKINLATNEIRIQKEEVTKQKELIEEAHKEITDSIRYAKRIQSAILPSQNDVDSLMPKSFIMYRPKDVVAGDFYWLQSWEGKTMLAAADCTGHGVPGAMVSVFCNNGLNRSVREHACTSPSDILEKTRDIVIEEFKKSKDEIKDGMDIALCVLNGRTLEYAGANNPIWIIRKGQNELEEIKADKQPIGFFSCPKPYQTHEVTLNKGDRFYLFSDGFADQFGGEKGKKFKTANFKKLLLSIQGESMETQYELLIEAFDAWKGDLEQVDDVCVVGMEIE